VVKAEPVVVPPAAAAVAPGVAPVVETPAAVAEPVPVVVAPEPVPVFAASEPIAAAIATPVATVSEVELDAVSEPDSEMAPLDAYESGSSEPVASQPVDAWEGGAAPAPAAVAAASGTEAGGEAATLQRLAVDALMEAKGQTTAADAIADAEWSIAGETVTIQTEVSKIMLPTVVNAEAEKIVRTAVVTHTPGLRVVVLPGAKKADSGAKKPRAAASGSAQAKALGHPIVQEAQRLFRAEVRNVIDLSE
jgi:DNA polymerase-3 subunit gamma/tau